MSSPLPPEILNLIVDDLYGEPHALKACCVASKSWVSRTRRHLFTRIEFRAGQSTLQSWMTTFPDPSSSPVHHTRSLSIYDPSFFTAAGANARAWIRAFNCVFHLELDAGWWDGRQSDLAPIHGLSPTLRSFSIVCLYIQSSKVLDIVCSFPSLEDLTFRSLADDEADEWAIPSTSPRLTGYLDLAVRPSGGTRPIIRHLLELPRGIHFSRIELSCHNQDAELTLRLVSRCFATLKSLYVGCLFTATIARLPPLDLSKAAKLTDVEFQLAGPNIQWIIATFKTAEASNLQQIIIRTPVGFQDRIGANVRQEWQDLDRLLVELWTSRSILPKIVLVTYARMRWDHVEFVVDLLPMVMDRGAIDMDEHLAGSG